jgi:hypothetical protein
MLGHDSVYVNAHPEHLVKPGSIGCPHSGGCSAYTLQGFDSTVKSGSWEKQCGGRKPTGSLLGMQILRMWRNWIILSRLMKDMGVARGVGVVCERHPIGKNLWKWPWKSLIFEKTIPLSKSWRRACNSNSEPIQGMNYMLEPHHFYFLTYQNRVGSS